MHRNSIIGLLNQYSPEIDVELTFKYQFLDFISKNENCFLRENLQGHLTASAFVLNKAKTKTLLLHHAKLNRWLQPGGHADGDSDLAAVALKETQEETGLKNLELIDYKIFDIDIHTIPQRKDVPEHLHYDVRFLIIAQENEAFTVSHESTALAWIPLGEVVNYCNDASILRMVGKVG